MKKGFYFIVIDDKDKNGENFMRPELCEGSYEYYGKLFVHRSKDYNGWSHSWKVSHVDAGSNITSERTLSEAREIAKRLQGFSLWDLKDHGSLTKAIKCPSNADQIQEIKKILGLV